MKKKNIAMKKVLFIIGIIVLAGCCKQKPAPVKKAHISYYADGVAYDEDSFSSISLYWDDRLIDSMTAHGSCIIVRGADRNYDTIIDHFHP